MNTVKLWANVALPTGEIGKVVEAYHEAGQCIAIVRVGTQKRKVNAADLQATDKVATVEYQKRPFHHNTARLGVHYRRPAPSAWNMEMYHCKDFVD